MKLALVLPGGVDRTGEYRVIPVFLALIERLARDHEVHVFVLRQEAEPGEWDLVGARIHNIGDGWSRLRAVATLRTRGRDRGRSTVMAGSSQLVTGPSPASRPSSPLSSIMAPCLP